jgi:hypothetical protein
MAMKIFSKKKMAMKIVLEELTKPKENSIGIFGGGIQHYKILFKY